MNCGAIPDDLIESELFGHARGAFTGAVGAREGLVEAADGGTLFLDEVAELPLTAQAGLLRVLQDGEIRRVGSTATRRVDVRVLAATHRNLNELVAAHRFREDLFFRRVMEIQLPPLRERAEDIEALADNLLERACAQTNKPAMRFSPDALALIQRHAWPGNVRELENAVERAVILSDQSLISADILAIGPKPAASRQEGAKRESLDDYFRRFVLENENGMTETELARRLGISRKTLWERRQRLGIPRRR